MRRTRNLPTLLAVRTRRAWRSFSNWVIRREFDEGWLLMLFAAAIGSAAGSAVILFYGLIDRVRQLTGWAAETSGTVGLPWIALVTVPAGLLLSVQILKRGREEQSGEMVPALIRASVRNDGRVSVPDLIGKLASSAITLGCGGSLGAEGPVATAGATVGSGLAQLLRFGARRTRVLLACGTAAGISAAFNAPIAGVLFALEIVLGTFAVAALSPVVVASVMGAVVARWARGPAPAFAIPSEFVFSSPKELLLYVFLGLTLGVMAALFVRGFFVTQDLLHKISGHRTELAAVLGGLLVAGLGFVHPELLGDGRHGIELVLASQLTGLTALVLGLLKIVASGLTMGGGEREECSLPPCSWVPRSAAFSVSALRACFQGWESRRKRTPSSAWPRSSQERRSRRSRRSSSCSR